MNREILDRRFTSDQILERKDEHGEVFTYVEGAAVIARLNEAFGAEWSFQITEYRAEDAEVIVLGQLAGGGQTKTQFGSKVRESGSSLGDDVKAATTDCIKKCATLFGIGLHLYITETTVATTPPAPAAAKPPFPALPVPNGGGGAPANRGADTDGGSMDGRLTNKQLSAIFGISKAKGWSSKETREFTQQKFGKVPDFLTKREASTCIDSLKADSR